MVKRLYTDLAIIDVIADGFVAREIAAGLSHEDLSAKTGAAIAVAADCVTLTAPDL